MHSLAEVVCGICNIRFYKRDAHRVPVSKIPSIELLRVHSDFYDITSGIKETKNMHSNNKFDWDDEVALALVQNESEAGKSL